MRNQYSVSIIFPIAFIIFCSIAVTSYATDLSVGGGISYTPITSKLSVNDWGWEGSTSDHFNFATFSVFIDVAYVQAAVAYGMRVSGSYDSEGSFSGSGVYTNKETYLGLIVLLKYPFELANFVLFPLVGLESDLNLTYRDESGSDLKSILTLDEKDHLNMYFIKFGAGADISISRRTYLRPVVVLGYKLRSRLDKDVVDYYKTTYNLTDVTLNTWKWEITVLAGYRL